MTERPSAKPGLSYAARRRWSLVILLVGLPLYIVAAVTLLGWLGRPAFWLELVVYVGLGLLWALPFRFVFRSVGQADPDQADLGNAPATRELPDKPRSDEK